MYVVCTEDLYVNLPSGRYGLLSKLIIIIIIIIITNEV